MFHPGKRIEKNKSWIYYQEYTGEQDQIKKPPVILFLCPVKIYVTHITG
jgi:hypothetical protein